MAFTWIAEMVFGTSSSSLNSCYRTHIFRWDLDTIVFIMTAWRTGTMYRESNGDSGYLYRLILRDGMYPYSAPLATSLDS